MRIVYSPKAEKQMLALPLKLKIMAERKITALAAWPEVSGVQALGGGEDAYRIHAGDYRVLFHVQKGEIMIIEVTDRKEVYEKKGRRSRRDTDLVRVPRSSLRGGRNYAADLLRWGIAEDLKAARRHAGLTQKELAAAIGRTQSAVSGSESGAIRVASAYVEAVLRACDLPDDWKAPRYPTR